jgi:peptidoglycan/xylan/chitin deacetylase (PgdA/CDA1 family)
MLPVWRSVTAAFAVFVMASAATILVGSQSAAAASAEVVTAGRSGSRAVALTFDDGYDPAVCSRIAGTLRAHGAKGTFFINGNYLKAAPVRWRKILRGQAIANHTRSHRDLTRASDRVVRKQIRENEALHERILGQPMIKVLRPPYGAYDGRVRRIAGQLGYRQIVLWSVDTMDWKSSATVESVVARATGARPGAIILMHCDRAVTAAALPAIIRHYRARGIELLGLRRVLGG